MAKRKETLEIEDKLHYMCRKRRIYGCEEVTIGFVHDGHGNEIVDYCTMDSKGVLRCYEIKVSLADLKSHAKKSWYGHYNYLFVTPELYQKISSELSTFLPDYVGVALPCPDSWSDGVEIVRNAKRQQISEEQVMMLKDSLIRSMSYKIQKYRDAADMDKVRSLQSNLRKLEKENQEYQRGCASSQYIINKFERILRNYYGYDLDLQELIQLIEDREMVLPEEITLTLTARGRKINNYIITHSNNASLANK